MSRKVRVLIVGSAFAADFHLYAYSQCRDIAEVVAITGRNKEKAHALLKKYGLENCAVYDDYMRAIQEVDCDVVDICLPNYLHHEVAIAALNRGRHVICEKPLATTVEDGMDMVETANRVGKKLYYAEDWLFAPALNRAIEIIEEGAIGKPVFIRARECHSGSHSPYAQTIQYCGGGCLIHLGIHPIGFILALKEGKWTELTASISGGLGNNLMHKKLEGEDWACCIMKFADGTSAVVESNYVTKGGMEDVIDIYGTEGCLHVDITFSSPITCYSIPGLKYTVEKAEITTGWSKPAVDERFNLGYVDEIRHFMECALKDEDAKVGLRGVDGLEALRVVHLAYKSAKEGITIKNERIGVRP